MINYQQGAILATTLILLFVITLLGITAMQVTYMQEKMTANLQDKAYSFDAAESAIRAGEQWLIELTKEPPTLAICQSHPCVKETLKNIDIANQTQAWWQANAAEYVIPMQKNAHQPRYIIEFLHFVPDSPEVGHSISKSRGVYYYQITARGSGASDNAVSVIQTTVGRRF